MDNLLQLTEQPQHIILQQVGWVRLAKEISSYAHFEENINVLTTPPTARYKNHIESEYKLLRLYQQSVDIGEFQKYSVEQKKLLSTTVFSEYVKNLNKKEVHSIKDLNVYVLAFEIAIQTPAKIKELYLKFESLDESKKKFQRELVKEFRGFVDFTGQADYSRHPIIGPLVKQLNDHEKRSSEVVLEHVRKLSEEGKLQFSGYDIINGRYVVPYKTDKYSSSLGSIIHRSDSGSTLYIELKAFEEHSLKRNYLKEAIEFEIFNLEKNYTKTMQMYSDIVLMSLEMVQGNDKNFAKALWANSFGGCIPDISTDEKMECYDFYHPSIKDPVKNKFVLHNNESVLLISGPNTGGKSIILKALCINYLLMYAGLPVAASSAKLYPYQEIFYLASDGQDLNQGLSSFAAESLKILKILESITRKSLLLVDEIFSSTSSEEASIIAYSVMNYWLKQRLGHAIFTSHHQTLKSWAHANQQMTSAHVGFDDKTGAPTYVLHLGVPGSSHAIQIFEKFLSKSKIQDSLHEEIEDKKNSSIDYEQLIKNIQARELETQKKLKLEQQEVFRIKSALNAQIMDFESKKSVELSKFKEDLSHLKKKADNVITAAAHAPRKNLTNIVENEFWKINKEANEIANISEEKAKPDNQKQEKLQEAKEILVGNIYYSSQWKRPVEVISLAPNNLTAEVMMGNIKTRVKCVDLFEAKGQVKQRFTSYVDRHSIATTSLDARGMRLEDFEDAVENQLSFVISGEIPYLEIIHGHGDGVLKNWLWQYLKSNNKLFKYEVPDLSYGGLTKVYLV